MTGQESFGGCTVATTRYDAVIIGGGPGGLACTAMLTKWGLRTLLIEKNEHTGGKAVTVSRNGFQYELGPKLQVPMRGPAFQTLFRELGMESQLQAIPLEKAALLYRGRSGEYKTKYTTQETGQDPTPFFDLWELDEKERQDALRFMTEMVMMPPEKVDELDDLTMQEFVSRYEIPYPVYSYMAMHANASLAEPIDLVSASEQVKILQQIAFQGGGGYYKGGFGRVLDDIARWIQAHGGEIWTSTRVERIEVQDGRVTGVSTKEKGTVDTPIVISNAGIQPTVLKLVGEKHFDSSYINYVKDLVPGWCFTGVRYFLSKPVMKHNMYMIYADDTWWDMERYNKVKAGHVPEEIILFITVPANFDPEMAPPGKQCLITGTICSPDPEAKEIQMLYDKTDEILARLFPEAWAAVEYKECDGPAEVSRHTRDHVLPGQGGECVGLAQIVGQCGKYKPSPQSPIRGLFFTGCDAGSAGMGTHQATDSGMKVARLVHQYHLKRQAAR